MTTTLHAARLQAVTEALRAAGAERVLDLGCGDGALVLRLLVEPWIVHVTGVELDGAALEALGREVPPAAAGRVTLYQGSLLAPLPDVRLVEAVTLVEVMEHLPSDRLGALEHRVFAVLRPRVVVVTTPNADCNGLLGVPAHRRRRPDHAFEWGRARFRAWAEGVARRHGFAVTVDDVGGTHPSVGGPSQMAVFRRRTADAAAPPLTPPAGSGCRRTRPRLDPGCSRSRS